MDSYFDAWERFKGYERDCPHHGFTGAYLMSTIYITIDEKHQLSLDISRNGDFSTKTEEMARTLIDNLVASSNNKHFAEDETPHFNDPELQQMEEVMSIMKLFLENKHNTFPNYDKEGIV